MRTNISYYRSNYLALFCVFLIVSILTNPLLLFALIGLSLAWAWVLSQRNPGPITLGGKTFGPFEQKAGLGLITFLAVVLTGLSSTLFW
jgi:hypothetical protein